MKVLILGGSGMLGHKLWQVLSRRFDTFVTFRQSAQAYAHYKLFETARAIGNVSASDFDAVTKAVAQVRPQVVVNCIGIVKQDAAAKDPLTSININALFPHRLAELARAAGARLIHLSTDCVFSGRGGNYNEDNPPDAEDLYGRTKLLGEVGSPDCLTLRTSMIGRELAGSQGLVEWFLSQQGKTVRGFRRAIFSGLTTRALAEAIAWIIEEHPSLDGVWHVAAEPISKFDLLTLIKEKGGLQIEIEPDETFVCDRSLDGERFREITGFVPPHWSDMISQLFQDSTPYNEFRRSDC
ncbi:MAG TPA: SDR family oxidoreductase [Pyrinomonadaceae bacterium]|jgi:dTDP-4-dehydrorhamnose reductase